MNFIIALLAIFLHLSSPLKICSNQTKEFSIVPIENTTYYAVACDKKILVYDYSSDLLVNSVNHPKLNGTFERLEKIRGKNILISSDNLGILHFWNTET